MRINFSSFDNRSLHVRAGGGIDPERPLHCSRSLDPLRHSGPRAARTTAGVHIGRLFRTIFLIDYFTNPAFRSEMQHVLNRGEAVHTMQRAIHIGKIPLELTKHHDSLAAVSSALALLTNAVMAWNTMHM